MLEWMRTRQGLDALHRLLDAAERVVVAQERQAVAQEQIAAALTAKQGNGNGPLNG